MQVVVVLLERCPSLVMEDYLGPLDRGKHQWDLLHSSARSGYSVGE